MKIRQTLLSILLLTFAAGTAVGDMVLDTGTIFAMEASGGGFLAGTSSFNITAADIPNIVLLSDFDVVDAGIEIVVNGTALFPQFDDISQFGATQVFGGTGVGGGGVDNPFSPNNNGLPRVRVEASSTGISFTGAETTGTNTLIDYIPQFQPQDFTSLLVDGDNEIQFFVLNSFEGANLTGDFTVTQITPATSVPEPGATSVALLALLGSLTFRRRR